jgi:putative NADH-flavin reductase
MIVITTPTGDIGHRVLQHVLQGSEPVRVIARDPSRIPQEIRQRVEVTPGSHGDAATIEKALTGADALFWLIPPEPFMNMNSVDEAYANFTRPTQSRPTRTRVTARSDSLDSPHDAPSDAQVPMPPLR